MWALSMDEWREVFRQQMREAKPGDNWSLKNQDQLDVHSLEPGWERSLQERAHFFLFAYMYLPFLLLPSLISFACSQCDRTWSSYQVVILFHMLWEGTKRQGWVKRKLFRQQCQGCSSTQKERPLFTRKDVESVIQALILDIREKCYGERVRRIELLEVVCEGGGPHKREFCEACQMGLHKGHHGKPDGALHHGKSDTALHHGEFDGALHHGEFDTAVHHGKSDTVLHQGEFDGALHHGKFDTALHHGKFDTALHYGEF
ncbi:receptor-transporting protein 2-like [Heteronotia binoei]|uniref:receptor-transporting protein 2-like n=1 Tax=Heteronotia binoei TaxID=13085 RepID=UPI00292E2218|nr:receptor-transporting protein 2-like [Heteronotia binoei]